MSIVDPAITATGITCLVVVMIMYVVDWVADQREKKHWWEIRKELALNGQKKE